MEKFTLINKDRSRIKVFEPFEYVSKPKLKTGVFGVRIIKLMRLGNLMT